MPGESGLPKWFQLTRNLSTARLVFLTLFAAVVLLGGFSVAAAEPVPSFRHDVMPVFSKAGCNLGTCHGNLNGKGGFKLSLRGQDPTLDHARVTRGQFARRINLLDPAASLLLMKPSMQLAHEGGRRFGSDDPEYALLHRWISAGAPGVLDQERQLVRLDVTPNELVVLAPQDGVQLRATAHYSDGSTRDVTRLAVYEVTGERAVVNAEGMVTRRAMGEATILVRLLDHQQPVRLAFVPARPDFTWRGPPAENYIDQLIHARLQSRRLNPSPEVAEHLYLRRVYLDALGVLPTAAEAQAYLADERPDRRARVIDTLLVRPEFAQLWALRWSDLLRNEENLLDTRGVTVFHRWLVESFAAGKPLDQLARDLLLAEGSTYDNPPANYWRALRDPVTRGETTAQVFLGVRLQCAKCHNHPFESWTQDDYYNWAALFSRVDYKIVKNEPKDKRDKNEFVGEQIVLLTDEGDIDNPQSGKVAPPQLLGEPPLKLQPKVDRRAALAAWLTEDQERMFARAQANRIWYYLLGRGLVEPIDDFRATNPAINPELLDALTEDFIAGGYDLRHLVRRIMHSATYRAASLPNETNADDAENFSRALVRRLPAEQLLDAIGQVLDVPVAFNGYPHGTRAGQLAGVERIRLRDQPPAIGDRFLTLFGKPQRRLACECERSNETTLSQALVLIGGEELDELLSASSGRLARLASGDQSPEECVTKLYWHALSRPPEPNELAAAVERFKEGARRETLEDVAWALLNSKEFLFRN